jgi:hypothetical protein
MKIPVEYHGYIDWKIPQLYVWSIVGSSNQPIYVPLSPGGLMIGLVSALTALLLRVTHARIRELSDIIF